MFCLLFINTSPPSDLHCFAKCTRHCQRNLNSIFFRLIQTSTLNWMQILFKLKDGYSNSFSYALDLVSVLSANHTLQTLPASLPSSLLQNSLSKALRKLPQPSVFIFESQIHDLNPDFEWQSTSQRDLTSTRITFSTLASKRTCSVNCEPIKINPNSFLFLPMQKVHQVNYDFFFRSYLPLKNFTASTFVKKYYENVATCYRLASKTSNI